MLSQKYNESVVYTIITNTDNSIKEIKEALTKSGLNTKSRELLKKALYSLEHTKVFGQEVLDESLYYH